VKASIKLRFTNRAGHSMVAVRAMELDQKKTKMTFKQLDGALRTVDKDGNRQALSHKCSELDKQIPLMLGVSKAILEHVVFCHQEDASWPLQDAAVVKKRFDDIFDSSRYTKALEVFSKLKKDYTSKVKDLKADLSGLASHRHAAKGFQKDMEGHNAQLEDLEDEISDMKCEIKENDEEQERVKAIIDQVDDIETEIDSQTNGLVAEERIVASRRKMLNEDLTENHAVRELKEMLRDFESEIGLQIDKKKELEEEIGDLHRELAKLRKQREEMQSRLGRLQAAKERHETVLKRRFEQMMSIGQKYGLGDVLTPISQTQPSQTQNTSYNASSMGDMSMSVHETPQQPVLNISQEDMEEFYRALDKKEKELKEDSEHLKKTNQEQEDQISSQLTDIGGQLRSIENDRKKLEKEHDGARKELSRIGTQLTSTSRLRKSDVEEAKRNAAEIAKKRDETNDNPRRTQVPIEIRSVEEKMDKLKRDLEDDKMALTMLRHSAEAQNAIVVLKEQSAKELESLQDSIKDLGYVFQQYNITDPGELPSTLEDTSGEDLTQTVSKIVDELSDKYHGLTLEQSKTSGEVNRLQKTVSENQALLAHNQRALSSKKLSIGQLDAKNGSIDKIRRVAVELRRFESEHGVTTPVSLDESKPQELQSYLDTKLEEEESTSTEGIQPAVVRKIMKKLLKQVSVFNTRSSVLGY
jgi:DNA repair protein RAD50